MVVYVPMEIGLCLPFTNPFQLECIVDIDLYCKYNIEFVWLDINGDRMLSE